jgi:hypothetical protein
MEQNAVLGLILLQQQQDQVERAVDMKKAGPRPT